MGKAAKLKKIRKLATMLPTLQQKKVVREKMTGYELLDLGITEVNGNAVVVSGIYTKTQKVVADADHYKNMKKCFAKHGAIAVKHYAEAAISYAKEKNIPLNDNNV